MKERKSNIVTNMFLYLLVSIVIGSLFYCDNNPQEPDQISLNVINNYSDQSIVVGFFYNDTLYWIDDEQLINTDNSQNHYVISAVMESQQQTVLISYGSLALNDDAACLVSEEGVSWWF